MEEYPLISAIVPVYNGVDYIKTVYDNISKQTYPNIEVIFVDNNSTDGSINEIKNLQKNNDHIFLFHEKVQGAGAARNLGVENSNGEYIAFFDVDDIYTSDKVSSLVNVLRNNSNIGMVFGKISVKYQNGREYNPEYKHIKSGINYPTDLAIKFLNFGSGAPTQAVMCRKDAFFYINGFEGDMLIGEDMAFSFKMAMNYPIYFLPKIVCNYYRHPKSTLEKYKKENPNLSYYYDQHKRFYLPYIYNNNLFLVSKKLKIIYQYCLKGLINQARMYNYSFFSRIKYLYKELKYLNKFGLSFCYFPFILISSFANQYLYRIMIKIFTKIKSYNY